MQIARKAAIGAQVMLDLATNGRRGPVPLGELAQRQGISAKYLEQLIMPLKGAGLVKSVRGTKGGYLLALDPAHITLLSVVNAMEGPITTPPITHGSLDKTWELMGHNLAVYLETRTLATLMGMQAQETAD